MKFARYLEDSQAPEWKKAYIDYCGLKDRITSISTWQAGIHPLPSTVDEVNADADVKIKSKCSADEHISRKTKHLRRLSIPLSIRSRHSHPEPLLLYSILLTLPPIHIEFFTYLDKQLAKIDKFYSEREKEAQARSKTLEIQLRELEDHRKIFLGAYSNEGLWWSTSLKFNIQLLPGSKPVANVISAPTSTLRLGILGKGKPYEAQEIELDSRRRMKHIQLEEDVNSTTVRNSDSTTLSYPPRLDPEEYRYARKKLKKAMQEHYRGLEALNNYRILNITGFRKALKKYQKVAKIPAQQAYMKEKVETSSFASSASVGAMLQQAEELFTARFGRGDKKRSLAQLRPASQRRSYHSSTLRSGIMLGLALPALVSGIYQSYQPHRRAQIPAWDVLLFIYSIFLVPVLFSLLIGVNLWIWSNARINYVFIFELDVRTRLDCRQYFELPAILLASLCYAFWLSFHNVAFPTLWPLIWLGFATVVIINPMPVLSKPSRWWLMRSIGELLISGVHPVEFIDFWMGDQFCSLLFTLSNIYFIICAYAHDVQPNAWQQCGTQTRVGWLSSFMLAMLPLLARLIQSVRRYIDSNLMIHLINGGKYGSGIVYYFCFFLWRYHDNEDRGAYFVLFCLTGTIYSIYSCAWDVLMDWSFFKPGSKYPLLRPDLVYTNAIPFYYFGLVSNVLMKFNWVIFIPRQGPSIILRTFIGAMLDMLRRWQWNIYRLENEHLGNMDQYRITREVPLPYQIHEITQEDDGDEDSVSRKQWLSARSSIIKSVDESPA